MFDFITGDFITGMIGMFLILLAFFLNEFHQRWGKDSAKYNLTNIFGSGLLVYYSFILDSWPFIILNLAWFLTAGVKLVKILR